MIRIRIGMRRRMMAHGKPAYSQEGERNRGMKPPPDCAGHGQSYEAKLSFAISMMERSSLLMALIVPSISGSTFLMKYRAALSLPS